MQSDTYKIVSSGLVGELNALALSEVVEHLVNYTGNFLLDPSVSIIYINRFIADAEIGGSSHAVNQLRYIARKFSLMEPFDIGGLEIGANIFHNQADKALLAYMNREQGVNKWESKIESIIANGEYVKAMEMLRKMLPAYPTSLRMANKLLGIMQRQGCIPETQFDGIKVPPEFAVPWKRRLFLTYAALGAVPRALALWQDIKEAVADEVALNHAAELYRMADDRDEAIRLYRASLDRDPGQTPVRYRLAELESPSLCDTSLLASRKVNIYLYSFNKAEMLRETLQSLARCDIGGARIAVLLNGCTDDSLAVTRQARALFPENDFEILTLPINIGAPAARNWLIALPETRAADYTVFLDDDITLQPDFLHRYLTVAENTENFGVIGCKILFPGEVPKIQYLYRTVSVVKDGLFRISLDAPNNQFDNGLYDFNRETLTVMGCCHMFSRQALLDVPSFDLCFSPSQMDDIAHDFDLALLGYKIIYCGHVRCVHWQKTGNFRQASYDMKRYGNIAGNDMKFYYRFCNRFSKLREIGRPALC